VVAWFYLSSPFTAGTTQLLPLPLKIFLPQRAQSKIKQTNIFLIRTNLQLTTSSSPFKGEVRRGMGLIVHQILPHPHPSPPLEGEGDFFWQEISTSE